jgi:hypothetical protein
MMVDREIVEAARTIRNGFRVRRRNRAIVLTAGDTATRAGRGFGEAPGKAGGGGSSA